MFEIHTKTSFEKGNVVQTSMKQIPLTNLRIPINNMAGDCLLLKVYIR